MARPLLRLFGPDWPTTIAEFREALRDAPIGAGIGDGRFLANIRASLNLPPAPERPDRPDRDPGHDPSARDLPPVPGLIDMVQAPAQQALAPVLAEEPPVAEAAARTDLFDEAPTPPHWDSPSAPFVRVEGARLAFIRDMELGPVPGAEFKSLRASGNREHRDIFEGPNDSPDSSHLAHCGTQPADLPPPPEFF